MNESTGIGYLKIRAVSAGGAFPVSGAVAIITDEESGNILYSLRTDISGLTETVALPAPPKGLSQTPGAAVPPYSTYTVQVTKDGYFGIESYTVPVFEGITSIQRADLIPKGELDVLTPENGSLNIETPGYPSLETNGAANDREN